MGDRLWTGKPSRYVTSQLDSAFYPLWDGRTLEFARDLGLTTDDLLN